MTQESTGATPSHPSGRPQRAGRGATPAAGGSTAGELPSPAAAWSSLCARLDRLGQQLLGGEFPDAPHDRAEGFGHLAEQVAVWLNWAVRHADPHRPRFHRHNDLVSQWGGPNGDNVYKHARIDPALAYRVSGHMHGCDDFILALRAGFMHMPEWGTKAQLTASDAGIGRRDEFELFLGGDPRDDVPWLELPAGTTMVSIREYYFDWEADEPATITIECLDDAPSPSRPTPPDVSARLEDAADLVERSLHFWNDYTTTRYAAATPNVFAGGFAQERGLAAALYDFCFYELADGEALLIDAEVPDARYWSFQLYSLGWFTLPDFDSRLTTLNHSQAHVSDDGRVRVVVAGRDPGVPNWLDVADHPVGQVTWRWFWPRSAAHPSVSTAVVPLADIRQHLPATTQPVDARARRAEWRARREHLAWRFRA